MTSQQHIEDHGLLRFLTCGSVDDGKSTLIGRLLFDTKTILVDTLSNLARTSERRGLTSVDLSLLTDGLQAEREQGITIDVAYRYFSTGTRKYIIADAPGHEQYTRNMVTAASTADLAIILVDARRGILTETRRHAKICQLLGIPQIVVAINKMDLVNYDVQVFAKLQEEFAQVAATIGLEKVRYVPMSALEGDMIVDRGDSMNWYEGPTLLEILETAPNSHSETPTHHEQFRMPVQLVCRPQDSANPELHDYRGFMGRISSGVVRPGDEVIALPSGQRSTVSHVELGGVELNEGVAEQSVTIRLSDEIDISRGDMIAHPDTAPQVVKEAQAMVCWLSETPLDRARTYALRQTTRTVKAKIADIPFRLDINTLAQDAAPAQLQMNDIATINLRLAQPICCDSYKNNRATGAFILIDEATNNTVGAGMLL